MTELTDEALAKAEPVTKEYDIDLIKNAGKWLITKESNTLFGLLGEER